MQLSEIAILDFGSQYTHLIARRVRELGVASRIYHNDAPASELKNATGLVLSGGPKSVLADEKLEYDKKIFDLSIPILGLCYGHQLIANHFGGQVARGTAREYGLAIMSPFTDHRSPVFEGVPEKTSVWMSHGDHVAILPPGFRQIARTDNDSIAAMAQDQKRIYGLQFHPEVNHTADGRKMLRNFLFNICQAEKNWSMEDMLGKIENEIKTQAGDKKIFLLVSGGVDSTVCFTLLEKALGKNRVYGFHVDHGLMRLNESQAVREALAEIGLDDLRIYNAEKEFLQRLSGITDPEKKRQIIGGLFLMITERVMEQLNFNADEWLLGQGTIYPDTIESGGTQNSDKIKTHHNRVDRVKKMIEKGLIIEPIKELYKDEVREIGRQLGLPDALVNRQPFPGPGLAIRCLCSDVSSTKPTPQHHNTTTLWKLPIKSVGVQGDERSYAHPAVLLNPPKDWLTLHQISPAITNQHPDINRVLITIYGDTDRLRHSTLHQSTLTKKRLDLLRELDARISAIVNAHPDAKHIWQMPIVLLPFGYDKGESLVIRPVESEEAMTVKFAKLPDQVINNIQSEIKNLQLVDFVFYDITNKPPGTIEWE